MSLVPAQADEKQRRKSYVEGVISYAGGEVSLPSPEKLTRRTKASSQDMTTMRSLNLEEVARLAGLQRLKTTELGSRAHYAADILKRTGKMASGDEVSFKVEGAAVTILAAPTPAHLAQRITQAAPELQVPHLREMSETFISQPAAIIPTDTPRLRTLCPDNSNAMQIMMDKNVSEETESEIDFEKFNRIMMPPLRPQPSRTRPKRNGLGALFVWCA
eukprot:GHVU01050659.1.p1 GENE.GHVU01050659.1~~GHVU01050659.1.p1  ORF type:complete len:217 (-),score=28.51 GHVU01050659.1:415-1065(-)